MQDPQTSSLAASASKYAAARAELASIEAAEFSEFAKKSGRSVSIGAFFLLVGYLALLIGLTLGLGNLINPRLRDTPLATFGGAGVMGVALGLLHLLIGGIVLLARTKAPAEGFFSYTRNELKRDKEWINNNNA